MIARHFSFGDNEIGRSTDNFSGHTNLPFKYNHVTFRYFSLKVTIQFLDIISKFLFSFFVF